MKRILILLPVLVALCAVGCAAEITAPDEFDNGIVPVTWVKVEAGEFLMGQHNDRTDIDYDYEIMVTPVTNEQYKDYLNAALAAGDTIEVISDEVIGPYAGDEFHGERHEVEIPAGNYLHVPLTDPDLRLVYDGVDTFSVEAGYENHPVTVVTWFGANAYCEYYDYRLPTEAEWEKAARGTEGLPFPWGNEIEHNNANFYNSKDPFERGTGKLGNTTPVGFYNGDTYDGYETVDSPSPYGLYDMAGNVLEWTGDIYEGVHYRYLRGGSKADYEHRLRVWTRENARPDYYSPNVGFRALRP
jgi:formylglycine-generating enzyme required for sulfatase activity